VAPLAAAFAALAVTWLLGSAPAVASPVRQQDWWLGKLGVTHAWRTSLGSGVIVAVLGDGVVASQPDLKGSVIAGRDFTLADEVDT
jgi:subtilisin family serine protease